MRSLRTKTLCTSWHLLLRVVWAPSDLNKWSVDGNMTHQCNPPQDPKAPQAIVQLRSYAGKMFLRSPSDFCSDFSPKSISSSSPSSPLLPSPYHPIPSTPDQTPLLINKFTQNHEKFSPALEKHNPALTFASAHLNLKTWTRNMFEHEMELWFSLKLKLFLLCLQKVLEDGLTYVDWHFRTFPILQRRTIRAPSKKLHQRLEAPSKRDNLFW